MSRCVVSLAFGECHASLAHLTWPMMAHYASQFDCDWRPHLEPIYPCSRPPPWHKLIAIAEALADHDEVLWLDVDVYVRDYSEYIGDYVGKIFWQALVMHNYLGGLAPNTGVWLVRRPMLPAIVAAAMSDDVHHPWWEQAAIQGLMGFTPVGPTVQAGELTRLAYRTHRLNEGWNHVESSPADVPARFLHAAGVSGDRAAYLSARS